MNLLFDMFWISAGVAIASYGEIHLNFLGTFFQITGILCEALRLVLTEVLLKKRGLSLNPITSLYYVAPCRFKLHRDSSYGLTDLNPFSLFFVPLKFCLPLHSMVLH